MRAAVLHEVGKPLQIDEVSIVKPGPQEVLIRTSACCVWTRSGARSWSLLSS